MSKPLHPKASALQRAGLFARLKSSDELETRIAALPDERSRGDAFEVFAESYLATQRRHDLPQVWPLAAVPTDVLRKLALPLNDYGVDGVAQTVLGGFDVYQVKFRSGRQPLTWRELSTFMGLADSAGIHSRVLFTNCDDLPAVMNERKGFFCIRGSDLDRLEASDFRAIEGWLAQAQVPTARKQPLPHQHEALDVLLPALRLHDRVTGIMACGTGKTLVALWITENVRKLSSFRSHSDGIAGPGQRSPVWNLSRLEPLQPRQSRRFSSRENGRTICPRERRTGDCSTQPAADAVSGRSCGLAHSRMGRLFATSGAANPRENPSPVEFPWPERTAPVP